MELEELIRKAQAGDREAQDRLIEEVHALARAYGWTEVEAMAMAPWRRARYLALIERERVR